MRWPGLGPGTTVVVEGEIIVKPIGWGMIAYQSIMIGAAYVVTFATRPWKVIYPTKPFSFHFHDLKIRIVAHSSFL